MLFVNLDGLYLSVFYCRCCVQDCLNQCCTSWRMVCVSRCCMMILLVIMCSSILQVVDVSDIGR